MSDAGSREWCGNLFPPRSDPRGRRARFCSAACRSAAYRARKNAEHVAELETARTQTSIDFTHAEGISPRIEKPFQADDLTIEQRYLIAMEVLEDAREQASKGNITEKVRSLSIVGKQVRAIVEVADETRKFEEQLQAQSHVRELKVNRSQRRATKKKRR